MVISTLPARGQSRRLDSPAKEKLGPASPLAGRESIPGPSHETGYPEYLLPRQTGYVEHVQNLLQGFHVPDTCRICHTPMPIVARDNYPSFSYLLNRARLRCNHHFHACCLERVALASPDRRGHCVRCLTPVVGHHKQFRVLMCTIWGDRNVYEDIGETIDIAAAGWRDPTFRRQLAFRDAICLRDLYRVEEFLRGENGFNTYPRMDPNAVLPSDGMPLLHMAALADDAPLLDLLLRYGADRRRVWQESTALGWARHLNCLNAVWRLEQP